jgi:hypothetical protein
MLRSGAMTLSDVRSATLTLVCEPCKRRGVYSAARLWAKHGDAALPDLQTYLSADCPKRANFSVYDRCQAMFEPGADPQWNRLRKEQGDPAVRDSGDCPRQESRRA